MKLIQVNCHDLQKTGFMIDCCGSCHSEWEGEYSQPSEIYREIIIDSLNIEFQFFICCGGCDVVKELKGEDFKKILEFKEKE